MKFWLADPKTQKKSVTLTMLWYGFLGCMMKLMLSQLTIMGITFEEFNGSAFAAIMVSLGGLYATRKYHSHKNNEDGGNEESGV